MAKNYQKLFKGPKIFLINHVQWKNIKNASIGGIVLALSNPELTGETQNFQVN